MLAVVALLLIGGCADTLVLHPAPFAAAPSAAKQRMIQFRDTPLQVWVLPPLDHATPAAFVLEFGGNATRAEWVLEPAARRWAEFHAEIWSPNYPGFGGSGGRASLSSIPESAVAVYDALRQVAGQRPIFVVGRSLGTTAALYVAAHRPVAGVVLHSATPLAKVIREDFAWFNFGLLSNSVADQIPPALDSIANAAYCTAPALFIKTMRDMLVRPTQQQAVIDSYWGSSTVLSLDSADHGRNLTADEETRVRVVIRAWIAQLPAGHP